MDDLIIGVEGCDAVGKDTFANLLSEKTGYEIIRGSSFEISELGADGMFEYSLELLERDDIILNRTFYSNLVYGKLFDYPMMTREQYGILSRKLNEKGIIVYLHADEFTLKKRMLHRGDDMIKINDISSIVSEYSKVMYHDTFSPKIMLSLNTSYESSRTMASTLVANIVNLDIAKIYTKF